MPNVTLQLVFRNQDGNQTTLTVRDPIQPVDSEQVEEVMDDIIEKNVFDSTGGDFVEKITARLVSREVEEVI
ncbi:DUF2922 domain-containing protein [Proteinivorax hydrogeniformans]|uniref:DUF2922 domain-containing protein n=1 Tax=Proteinivorax hydrogeniformans TaxID=1826727 RepID=A0AAU8HUU8_9FIRM